MRTLMLLAAACAAAAPGRAQVVHGRVVAVDGGSSRGRRPGAAGAGARRGLRVRAQADTLGRFALRPGRWGLPAGGRAAGRSRAVSPEFALGAGDSLEVLFRLSADAVLLNPLQVVASHRRPRRLEEFYDRAERGAFGWFVTREQMERRTAPRTTDLLWTAPGIDVLPGRGWGGVVRGRGGCVPAVYLDRMRMGAGSIDLCTDLDGLEGIDACTDAGAPVQYAGPGGGCAVVLLWTRFRGRPDPKPTSRAVEPIVARVS